MFEKCEKCKIDYPEGLLSPLATTGKGNGLLVCGICALSMMNEIHEIRRKKFKGPIAEQMRLAAVAHRKYLKLGRLDAQPN